MLVYVKMKCPGAWRVKPPKILGPSCPGKTDNCENDFKETYMGGGAWCKAPEMSMSRGIYYANCTD